jgi:hypothetical protein
MGGGEVRIVPPLPVLDHVEAELQGENFNEIGLLMGVTALVLLSVGGCGEASTNNL